MWMLELWKAFLLSFPFLLNMLAAQGLIAPQKSYRSVRSYWLVKQHLKLCYWTKSRIYFHYAHTSRKYNLIFTHAHWNSTWYSKCDLLFKPCISCPKYFIIQSLYLLFKLQLYTLVTRATVTFFVKSFLTYTVPKPIILFDLLKALSFHLRL